MAEGGGHNFFIFFFQLCLLCVNSKSRPVNSYPVMFVILGVPEEYFEGSLLFERFQIFVVLGLRAMEWSDSVYESLPCLEWTDLFFWCTIVADLN